MRPRRKGPIPLLRHELEKYGIGCTSMDAWDITGNRVQVTRTQGLALQLAGAARAALWRAEARLTMHLRGLERGRDEAAMAALTRTHEPEGCGHDGSCFADSVYTPARAHLRWGFAGGCTLCGGAEQGDWLHYINDCPHALRSADAPWMPDCLRYMGNAPAGWLQTPGSREMEAEDSWETRIQFPAVARWPRTAVA